MKKKKIEFFLYIFYCFAISYIFIPLSITDDQNLYIQAYEKNVEKSLSEAIISNNKILGFKEPVYTLITWFLSDFISKNSFALIVNLIFGYLLIKLFQRYRVNKLNIFLIFTGFYFFALMFSLERLKISFIFFLMIFFFSRKYLFNILLSLATIFTHLQTVPLVFLNTLLIKIKKKNIYSSILIFSVCIIAIFITFINFDLYNLLKNKILIYSNQIDLKYIAIEILKFIIFLMIGNFYLKKNILEFNILFFSLLPFVLFIQSGRIIIMCYMALTIFLILENKTNNKLFTIINIYFFIKGLLFLKNIYLFGNGYGNV